MMELLVGMLGILLVIGVPAAVSTYLTSIPCRILVSRQRSPGWYIAILIAVLVGGLAVLLLGGADLFHASKWDSGKVTLRELVPLWFAAASTCAFIPAWYAVAHYRDKLDEADEN